MDFIYEHLFFSYLNNFEISENKFTHHLVKEFYRQTCCRYLDETILKVDNEMPIRTVLFAVFLRVPLSKPLYPLLTNLKVQSLLNALPQAKV